MKPEIIEQDLPEETSYPDEGCEVFSSCLNCPLPRCVYEMTWGKQRWLKSQRNREMTRLFVGGEDVKEVARRFGVSERTVQRVLKDYRTAIGKGGKQK